MNKELKPCPFCGERAVLVASDKAFVICEDCGVATPVHDTEEEAIEVWNTRKPIDEIVEELNFEKGVAFMTLGNTGDEDYDFAYDNVMSYMNKAIDIVKKGGSDE